MLSSSRRGQCERVCSLIASSKNTLTNIFYVVIETCQERLFGFVSYNNSSFKSDIEIRKMNSALCLATRQIAHELTYLLQAISISDNTRKSFMWSKQRKNEPTGSDSSFSISGLYCPMWLSIRCPSQSAHSTHV